MKSAIISFAFLLASCGISHGPSLIEGATVTSPVADPFEQRINLTNGQAASGVIGQVDFTTSWGAHDGTTMTGSWYSGIYIAPDGKLFLSDSDGNRIMGFNSIPTNPYPNPIEFVFGTTSFTTFPANSTTNFREPGATSYDPGTGKFFVADTRNLRILIYNEMPGTGSTGYPFIPSQPYAVIGANNTTSAGGTSGPCNPLTFKPYEIVISHGKMAVLDSDGMRILIWDSVPTTDNVLPDRILGSATCAAGTNASEFGSPTTIWHNGTKLAIADYDNNRVLLWDSWPTQDGQAADHVIGQPDLTTVVQDNHPSTPGTVSEYGLSSPWGIYSNGSQVFVGDLGNRRVLVWDSWPTSDFEPAAVVLGQASFSTRAGGVSSTAMFGGYSIRSYRDKLIVNDADNARYLIFTSN